MYKALYRAVLKAVAVPSDFVTNSYGQSWDSSCKTSWVPVHNQWVPVQKKQGVINWKCFGLICNQTVNRETDAKTPYYSLLIIKRQSFYILKAQKLLKYFCIFKQQPQKSRKRDILPKNLEIDASFFASYRTHGIIIILFCTLGIFMHQGCRMQR